MTRLPCDDCTESAEWAARQRANLERENLDLHAEIEQLKATGRERYNDGYTSGRRAGSREAEARAAEAERALHREQDKTRALAAKIERVEALATECEGQHGQCWNSIFGQRIRAALADPKEDT